jgi:signal transduction histidine kinase
VTVPGSEGLIGEVIESGESRLTKGIVNDTELRRFVALRSCKVAYCLPLRAGLDTYGVLVFGHPELGYFSQSNREMLDIIAHQSVIAIQNARLYSDLGQEKERMMEIQDEARKKLARDLHDGPTQSIAAIAMRINFARRLMERNLKATADELYKIEELARRTTKEIRHMLFTLRPLVLESQGLVAALEAMSEKMRETYAQAAHVWVRLKGVDENLAVLEVEDDGVGFNVGSVSSSYDQRGSLGMLNMRERAELVNGVLRIDSAEGKGTRIQVLIPLSEEGADRLRRGQ